MRYDPTPGLLDIRTVVSEPITLSTNDIERLRITSAGRVGIGTDVPDASLHIHRDDVASYPAIWMSGSTKLNRRR